MKLSTTRIPDTYARSVLQRSRLFCVCLTALLSIGIVSGCGSEEDSSSRDDGNVGVPGESDELTLKRQELKKTRKERARAQKELRALTEQMEEQKQAQLRLADGKEVNLGLAQTTCLEASSDSDPQLVAMCERFTDRLEHATSMRELAEQLSRELSELSDEQSAATESLASERAQVEKMTELFEGYHSFLELFEELTGQTGVSAADLDDPLLDATQAELLASVELAQSALKASADNPIARARLSYDILSNGDKIAFQQVKDYCENNQAFTAELVEHCLNIEPYLTNPASLQTVKDIYSERIDAYRGHKNTLESFKAKRVSFSQTLKLLEDMAEPEQEAWTAEQLSAFLEQKSSDLEEQSEAISERAESIAQKNVTQSEQQAKLDLVEKELLEGQTLLSIYPALTQDQRAQVFALHDQIVDLQAQLSPLQILIAEHSERIKKLEDEILATIKA